MSVAKEQRMHSLTIPITYESRELFVVVVVHPDRANDLTMLTAAERHVYRLVLEGLSSCAIARVRGASVRTVINQLTAICRKFRVTTRSELASRRAS